MKPKPVHVLGRDYPSIRAFAEACGVAHRAVYHHLDRGASLEDIARRYGLWAPTDVVAGWGYALNDED